MTKFTLMQVPFISSKKDPMFGYYTIGLESKYPTHGFNTCDEYGNMEASFPHSEDDPYTGKYAFVDEATREAFLGETIYDDGLHFAIVKYTPEK